MMYHDRISRWLPLLLGTVFLALWTMALPVPAAADSSSVQEVIQSVSSDGLKVINQKRGEYNSYASKAKSKKVDLLGASTLGSFSEFGRLQYGADDLLPLLPSGLIDDVNRKVLNEYYRGYYEWYAGFMPPALYYGIYNDWYRALFVSWDSDVYVYGLPMFVWELFINQRNLHLTSDSPDAIARQIDAIKGQLDEQLKKADAYIATGPTDKAPGWQFWRKNKKNFNRASWNAIRGSYEDLMRQWQKLLSSMKDSVDSKIMAELEKSVRWDRRMVVRIGSYWDWTKLDTMISTNLPSSMQQEINRRLAKAYFKGAYDRKYDRDQQSGTGNGYSYDYSSPYGTGNGNYYGTGRGTGYGGVGEYTGRTRRALSTGDGNVGSGTGSGTGSGSGSGTGSGRPDYDGLNGGTGSGSGSYNGGTGSGSGSGSYGSGTGTGSGSYGSGSGTGSGTGSGSRSSGTGTGSGSGTSRGSGTGTGSGY